MAVVRYSKITSILYFSTRNIFRMEAVLKSCYDDGSFTYVIGTKARSFQEWTQSRDNLELASCSVCRVPGCHLRDRSCHCWDINESQKSSEWGPPVRQNGCCPGSSCQSSDKRLSDRFKSIILESVRNIFQEFSRNTVDRVLISK